MRWELLPFPNRADRGVELYDPTTNQMPICGIGSIPQNCGVNIGKLGFGLEWRVSNSLVLRAGYGITRDPFDVGPRGVRTNYPVLFSMNLQGANTYQPAGQWDSGLPPIPVPDLANGIIPVPSDAVVHAMPKDIHRGYIQSWNFTLQKEVRYGFVAQAAYVATRSIRQFVTFDQNAGQAVGAGIAEQPSYQRFGRTGTTQLYTPMGTSLYDGLQATLQRRFANGFQIAAAYTWSKARGTSSDIQAGLRVQALPYFNLNRSVLGFDRMQTFNLSEVWELPFGAKKRWANHGLHSRVLGGWQINSLFTAMTGLPFSVTASATSLNMPGSTQRADQVLPKVRILHGYGAGAPYFDPQAFKPVTEVRFGNAGFNSLRGPGLLNCDVGLFRQFTLTEHIRLQFRAEAFNVTNTPHWGLPGSNVSNVSYSQDGSIRDLGGFATITNTDASYLGWAGRAQTSACSVSGCGFRFEASSSGSISFGWAIRICSGVPCARNSICYNTHELTQGIPAFSPPAFCARGDATQQSRASVTSWFNK